MWLKLVVTVLRQVRVRLRVLLAGMGQKVLFIRFHLLQRRQGWSAAGHRMDSKARVERLWLLLLRQWLRHQLWCLRLLLRRASLLLSVAGAQEL